MIIRWQKKPLLNYNMYNRGRKANTRVFCHFAILYLIRMAIVYYSRWTIVTHHDSRSNHLFFISHFINNCLHFTRVCFMVASLLIICSPIHLSTLSFNLKMLKSEIWNRHAKSNTFEANYVTSHPYCVKSFRYQDNLRLSIRCGISHVANVTSLPPKCAACCWSSASSVWCQTQWNIINIPSNRIEFSRICFVFFCFFSLRFFRFSELTKFIFYEFRWLVLRSSEKL